MAGIGILRHSRHFSSSLSEPTEEDLRHRQEGSLINSRMRSARTGRGLL